MKYILISHFFHKNSNFLTKYLKVTIQRMWHLITSIRSFKTVRIRKNDIIRYITLLQKIRRIQKLRENANFRKAIFSSLQMTCFKISDGICSKFDSETLQNTLQPEKRSIAFSIISHQLSKMFAKKNVDDVNFVIFRKKQLLKENSKICA